MIGADRRYLRVLGAVELVGIDGPVEVTATQRRILGRLAAESPGSVSVDQLAVVIWEGRPPAAARQAVQNQISRMRRAAGDDVIITTGDGYRLGVPTDADELIAAAMDAERLVADERPGEAFELIDTALGSAAGVRVDEIGDIGEPYRKRIEAARYAGQNTRLEAALRLGRRTWALVEAERLAAEAPLDEHRAALYARALTALGRRSDALAVIGRVRQALRMNLGLEPGADLVAAEGEILSGAADGGGGRGDRAAPVFVGREDELRRILQYVARREPVRVRGEHGSGISRILFEVRHRLVALGVKAILVRAEENPHSATSLVEELLVELDHPIGPMQSAITAFEAAVASITENSPTVFLIDDVQFLGPSAWQAIRAVAAAEYGGLVLGGHGRAIALDHEVVVPLGPLDDAAVAVIARHFGVTDPRSVARVAAAAGGNPLAVGLIAPSVAGSGAEWRGESSAHVPGAHRGDTTQGDGGARSVASLRVGAPEEAGYLPDFAAFIDQLIGDRDAARRHDLRLAAVAGDGYPVDALSHLDWPHIPQPPEDLVEIDHAGTMRFRHGAVQAHAYRMVPRGMALDMHYALGRAAQASGAPAGIVARHLLAAAELDPAGAVEAARDAARAATRLAAHADAASWLDQARTIAPGGDAGTAVLLDIEYGDALRLMGHPDHMPQLVAAARHALELGDDRLIAAAGFALLQLGGSSPAGALDSDLTELVGGVIRSIADPEIRAPVQAAASLAWSMTGHAEEARALFEEAESAARNAPTRMAVLPFAYLALGLPADLPRRSAVADELVALAQEAKEPAALWEGRHLQFSVAIQRGDGPAARAALAEMESLIDEIGDVGRRWSTLYCAATVAELDGDDARAEDLAERAHRTFAAVSPARAAAAYYAQLLPLRLAQGRVTELWPIVASLVVEQPGVTAWHAAAAVILAQQVPAAGGGDRAARDHAQAALDLAQQDFTWLAAHVIGGRAAALVGERELAAQYLDRLTPWIDQVCWQGTCSYGPVAEVVAQLCEVVGDGARAAEAAARAAELRDSLTAVGTGP